MTEPHTYSPFSMSLLEKLPGYLSTLTNALEQESTFGAHDKLLLRTYLGEARIGLELIAPHLQPGQKVLEIGSGIGALGSFLAFRGVDITGIEPSGDGFGKMAMFANWISAQISQQSSFSSLDRRCEDLNVDDNGTFDLIFSVHVLEHIQALDAAFAGMVKVLKPEGMMAHICPNYNFPYEPHFTMPVLFWSPRLTHFIYKARIKEDPNLWASLNFVGTRRIKSLAKEHTLKTEFQKGIMASYFTRLLEDPVFTERHNGFAAKMATLLANSPLIKLFAKAPPEITSPMSFTLRWPAKNPRE